MNIKTKILCHLRAKKQMLVLLLGTDTAHLSLWQQGERLWQEEQSQGDDEVALADDVEKQTGTVFSVMLECWLRDALLAHDVEEGVSMLIVLYDDLLQTEQLTLPKLPTKQLKKTLAWEAGQLFNLPQGSYSYCYQILAATAESMGQTERVKAAIRVNDKQEAEQQVVQLWVLAHVRQAEYAVLAQRLMVKLEGICIGVEGKLLASVQAEVSEAKQHDDRTLVEKIAQSWFAGEALLLLPELPRRIDWQDCYGKCAHHLPRVAKAMAVCACLSFACSFGLHYLAQADLKAVQQEAERYAVWQERQKESVILEKQLAKLKQQEKQKPQMLASKELEQWGRLGLTDIYLTELEYRYSSIKQGRQSGVTVTQGVSVSADSLDVLLEKLQTSKQYSSVQLVEAQQQAGGVSFKLQLGGK